MLRSLWGWETKVCVILLWGKRFFFAVSRLTRLRQQSLPSGNCAAYELKPTDQLIGIIQKCDNLLISCVNYMPHGDFEIPILRRHEEALECIGMCWCREVSLNKKNSYQRPIFFTKQPFISCFVLLDIGLIAEQIQELTNFHKKYVSQDGFIF